MTNYIPLKYWNGTAWVNVGHPGPAGASAYELAVANGYTGTLQEFTDSLTSPAASDVTLDTSTFNNNLDNTVDTVQKLAEEVDSLSTSASTISVKNNGVAMTPRSFINFSGPGVSLADDPTNNEIDVSVGGLVPNTAGQAHHPLMAGLVDNFGVSGRAYYIPFIGPARTFNRAVFSVATADAAATVSIAIYYRASPGDYNITKIHTFGTRNTWSSPSTYNSFSITAPTTWSPTAGTQYWIGVLVTGTMKLMSGTILPASQSNSPTFVMPPAAGYMSTETNLTSLPSTDLAPFLGSISPYAPYVLLDTA